MFCGYFDIFQHFQDAAYYSSSIISSGLAYTVRSLDTFKPNVDDIDQFKTDEYPLKSSQEHLDLFPTGRFGEFHPHDQHLTYSEYTSKQQRL